MIFTIGRGTGDGLDSANCRTLRAEHNKWFPVEFKA